MHDASGRPLNIGDQVLVPCKIVELNPGAAEDCCFVRLQSALVFGPDSKRTDFAGVNTSLLVRSNDGDEYSQPVAFGYRQAEPVSETPTA